MSVAAIPEAIVAFLAADSSVEALVDDRVYGLRLPADDSESMPRCAVVVKLSPVVGAGANGWEEVETIGIDVWNYGGDEAEALAVARATHEALKAIVRVEQNNVVIYSAQLIASMRDLLDEDGRWPLVVETWRILAAEYTTA